MGSRTRSIYPNVRPKPTAAPRSATGEGDLVICKRARPVLVLHERKTRVTLMTRLMGKTAGETVAAIQAVFKRLAGPMRGSITFDNGTDGVDAPKRHLCAKIAVS